MLHITLIKTLILFILSISITSITIFNDPKGVDMKKDWFKLIQILIILMFLTTLLPVWR